MSIDADLFRDQVWNETSRVVVLLRGHLTVEYVLEKLLEIELTRPEALQLDRLSWDAKLRACDAHALLEEWAVAALSRFNRMRNTLIHDLRGEPTAHDIEALVTLSSPVVQSTVPRLREGLRKAGDDLGDGPLSDLKIWLFCMVAALDYRLEANEYEKLHHEDVFKATITRLLSEKGDSPLSQVEAEEQVGLPPRPQPGDSFRGWLR